MSMLYSLQSLLLEETQSCLLCQFLLAEQKSEPLRATNPFKVESIGEIHWTPSYEWTPGCMPGNPLFVEDDGQLTERYNKCDD